MEKTLYIFKNKYEIAGYNGEVLTKRVGDVITETIKEPTEEQLKEFGFKELENTVRPDGKKGYVIEPYYEVDGDKIKQCYEQVKE
ncbi:hypothetical protein IJJ05_00380 [Candidatus Saccharibacteria bacterium]|nr:hypothetical protein [Candidatus Saccharibacteria bacterium]